MPKFNIYYTIQRGARKFESANHSNPIEVDCLKDAIICVGAAMPDEPNDSIPERVIAVRIEEIVHCEEDLKNHLMNKHKYLSEQWFAYRRRKRDRFINGTIIITVVLIILALVFEG
jgi:hypothetical protein